MNKSDIYVIVALTISSLLLLPTFSSASSTPNVSISVKGVLQYPALDPSTPINKGAVVYGASSFTAAEISFIASHFTLLSIGFETSTSSLQGIKSANPNMKILGYKDAMGMATYLDDWTTVNANESWFVHDASGSRIMMTVFGWYLMDVGNAGWRQHWVSYVNSKINSYDGVFTDDVWNTIPDWALPNFDKTVPSSVIARWHTDMMGFLQYAKANLISGKVLFVNSDEFDTNDYLNIADGEMIEGYEHAPWGSITTFGRPSIDVLARKSATGKIVWAESGMDTTGVSQTQIDAMLKYCYSSFLIGMNGAKAYWGWNLGGTYVGSIPNNYQTIMDTSMGQPTGAYYVSQGVYMRDFTGGKVLFNPSANSHTVSLGGNYQLLNGAVVSSIVLALWSGEILLSLT